MSLLVDPEYFLHALKLNYLRRLPDPNGPTSISFKSTSQQNPYLQLSGLTDLKRWPELMVTGSPPDPIPTRQRRQQNQNPSGSSLRYSETIVGPKGSGSGAGMRVSGRKSIRNSRGRGMMLQSDSKPPDNPEPVASGSGTQNSTTKAGATALALTEGRAKIISGVGLDPEESDEDENRSRTVAQEDDELKVQQTLHSRQTTADTIKGHRRRVSAVSFAQPLPPIQQTSTGFKRLRSHTASSTATNNTINSSDMDADTTQNSSRMIQEDIQEEMKEEVPSRIATATVSAEAYYSREHDPDKRLSDLLFNYKPNRRTQIVGSVGFEPAPLLVEEEEEEEESESESGTEAGVESSSNLEEGDEEEEEEEEKTGTSSTDAYSTNSFGKSLSNTIPDSVMEANLLLNHQPPPSSSSSTSQKPNGITSEPIPAIRRRERRRVNIKMGQLVGSPIIEEENGQEEGKTTPTTATRKRMVNINPLAASRPSLPDLRRAIKVQNRVSQADPTEEEKAELANLNSFSPGGRARSLTTPTPIPTIAVEVDSSGSVVSRTPRRRRGRSSPKSINTPGQLLTTTTIETRKNSITSPSKDSFGSSPASHTSSKIKTKRGGITFKKIEVKPSSIPSSATKSKLTELLTSKSKDPTTENPFRCLYSLLSSKERNAIKLKMYFPFSKEPKKPINRSIRTDVCVEEVIGFGLWAYIEEDREPKLDEIEGGKDLIETWAWSLRLVEDDGEVDEDFPALERTRGIGKVGSNEFAIVIASESQAKQNAIAQSQIQRRPSRILGEPNRGPRPSASSSTTNLLPLPINATTGLSGTTFDSRRTGGLSDSLVMGGGLGGATFTGASIMGIPVYLKIRIPSPGRGVDSIMTTLNVSMDMYLADVLEMLCKKKGLGSSKEWALVVPAQSIGTQTSQQRDILVPLDRTVESLQGVTSLGLMKRNQVSSKLLIGMAGMNNTNTNPSASIFKRLSEPPEPKYVSINDLVKSNKSFVVQIRRRGILGKHERVLSIEDDYVHIGTGLLGGGKISSYHVSQIVDCLIRGGSHGNNNNSCGVKLIVARESGEKRYEVEAENAKSAAEIVRHIKGLKDMYHTHK